MVSSAPEVLTSAAAREGALRAQCLRDPAASIEEALERTAGVSGAIPSGPLSLAARVSEFAPSDMDQALQQFPSLLTSP